MKYKLNDKLSNGSYVNQSICPIRCSIIINLVICALFLFKTIDCSTARLNVAEEILKSVKNLQDNCQQWTSRPLAEETFMENLASRLSLTEAKLENAISNIKLSESQRLVETKLNSIERLVENNFDRLAKKFEEMSETIRGLQTMVIINHNSTEEKIKKLLNTVTGLLNEQWSNGQREESTSTSADLIGELQTFLEQKLINTEKLINRHVTLVKDEIKEMVGDYRMKSWTNELSSSIVDNSDNADLVGIFNQMRSEVNHKVDKIENQVKFANQEINFKLDNQLGLLKNLTDRHPLIHNVQSFSYERNQSKDTRSQESSTLLPISIELMPTEPFADQTNETAKSDKSLGDNLANKKYRCQVQPNKTALVDCEIMSFRSSWKTCVDIYNDNITCDGVYLIMMDPRPSRVWCDMSDNGGGWMVILRRGNFENKSTPTSFNQNWFLYKYGFGDQKDEYWLGNEHIHRLTSSTPHQLQIDLESYDGQCISLDYGHFKIDSEEKAYRLVVADARGPHAVIGEQLLLYNNSAFNTRDRVNNHNSLRCGHFNGGWWFNGYACFEIFLTGELSGQDDYKGQLPGIHWYSWKPNKALKSVQMKIRPVLK